MSKKIEKASLISIFFFTVMFSLVFSAPKAQAIPVFDAGDIATNTLSLYQEAMTQITTLQEYAQTIQEYQKKVQGSATLLQAKQKALSDIRKNITREYFSGDNNLQITDYDDYLNKTPKKEALSGMEEKGGFYDEVSNGRSSAFSYEVAGGRTDFDSYFASQSKSALTSNSPKTTLQNRVSSPNAIFNGNMKGLVSYMECGNNPACYSLAAEKTYEEKTGELKEVAKAQETDGYKPKIENGKIVKPSELVKNASLQVENMGINFINTAGNGEQTMNDAINQVLIGTDISLNSYLGKYGLSTSDLQDAADLFSFSL